MSLTERQRQLVCTSCGEKRWVPYTDGLNRWWNSVGKKCKACRQKCPHCGRDMYQPAPAIACGPDGSAAVALPPYCQSEECRKGRDDAAIARGIAKGLIDP